MSHFTLLLLTCLVGSSFSYVDRRNPHRPYKLPPLPGGVRGPTPTFPGRDHGLPDYYKGRFSRSIHLDENDFKRSEESYVRTGRDLTALNRQIDENQAVEEQLVQRTKRASEPKTIKTVYRRPQPKPTPRKTYKI